MDANFIPVARVVSFIYSLSPLQSLIMYDVCRHSSQWSLWSSVISTEQLVNLQSEVYFGSGEWEVKGGLFVDFEDSVGVKRCVE